MDEVISDYRRIVDGVQSIVDGIDEDDWARPTPCTEWTVRDLLNHLVSGQRRLGRMARGEQPPASGTDVLGADPKGAFRDATAEVEALAATPGMLEKRLVTPLGEQPGSFVVVLQGNELMVHGWDLARSLGASVDPLPADIADRTLRMWQERLARMHRPEGGPFAAEQPVASDAPASDRLAAYLGRSADWAPPAAG
ncbi:MAG TPA: TIGR03086 family metal-binding protein [Candidatus Dormibacteraeota bacterium]|jgi:uncharacterized protein (TIGR03086 family)|nr:TIGR03086 family metal-binding protein [Candidatus Dormibacteraeota bacterium]